MPIQSFVGLLAKVFRVVAYTMILSWLCFSPPSSAQTQIPCGQIITGSIAVAGEEDRYTFSASNGDVVHVRQATQSNNFSIQIRLLNPGNQVIAISLSTITHALTQAGTYTIAVTRSSGTSQTGDYELLWQQIKNPCSYTQITQCQTLRGSINSPADLDAYLFNGTTGQTVRFRLRELTTNFESPSRFELYDPDGILLVLASGVITQPLSKTGVYTLLVGTDLASGMAGTYTLTMGNIEALLLTPNGGEVLSVGSTVPIKWLANADNPFLASHDILFSTDGGATFPIVIAKELPPFQLPTYNWIIPPTLATSNGRIRVIVRDTAGNTCQDDSDTSFIIAGLASTTAVAYKYDELNRLTQTVYDDGTAITYTYDAAGNRLTEAVAPIPFFKIMGNPSSIGVNKNGSGNSMLTVTSLNGFNSAVTLTCVGAPSGASCSFSPATITPIANGTANSTLTVTLTGVQPGIYSFQVRGTSGSLTRTFDMLLMVRDFAVSSNASSLSVSVSGNATTTCAITSINEFSSAVSLSCSGAPAGITCSLNPATVTPASNGMVTSTLTVNAGSAVTLGTFTLQVRGTVGSNVHTSNITLTVVAVPSGPLLLNENLSGGIPSGWTVINGGSGGGSSETWTTANPCNRSIGTAFAAPFAIVDGICAGSSATQDEQLITPTINASGCSRVMLEFSNQLLLTSTEVADVDVSTDGGSIWTNVLRMQGAPDGFPTPNIKLIDITATIASNPSNVKVRFHYYNGSFDGFWAIDNVKIKCNSCELSLSPISRFFGKRGGAGSVNVTTGSGCPWTVTNNVSWIDIVSNNSGIGNGRVDFAIRDNITGNPRQGIFSIAGQTFTVFQDAGLGSNCQNSITPTEATVPSSGGTGSIQVAAEVRCAWQVSSNVSWITITSSSFGVGNGVVTYLVGPNSGLSGRAGKITVAGKTFSIKQL